MFAKADQNYLLLENNSLFDVTAKIDFFSRRIWVEDYFYKDPEKLTGFLTDIAKYHRLEKIIFPVQKEDICTIKSAGFKLEGWIDGYFNGEDGYFMTCYPLPERSRDPLRNKMLGTLGSILASPRKPPVLLTGEYELFTPGLKEIPVLTDLYRKSFSTYPSPVDQPDYLAGVMGKSALVKAIRKGNRIISAATAEINETAGRAELTDCVTMPGNRGGGLMGVIINALQNECVSRGIYCIYSLARASSYGMNLVFHRLGFRYRGTLVNNCHICGSYENMNIWSKYAG